MDFKIAEPIKRNYMHDRGIKLAIERGDIVISSFNDEQIQPATLDIRVGGVSVYGKEYRNRQPKKPMPVDFDYEPPRLEPKILEENEPFVIEPNDFAELYFLDDIDWDEEIFDVTYELRSSRGRLGLRPNTLSIEKDSEGRKYFSVFNHNPNPLILYGHDRFAQLFFHPRDIKSDYFMGLGGVEILSKSAAKACIENDFKMLGSYVLLNFGDYFMKYKENIGPIDTGKKNRDEDIFEKFESGVINVGETAIVQLKQKLNLSDVVGLRVLPGFPLPQNSFQFKPDPTYAYFENFRCNSGWIDPGYNGQITAHVIPIKNGIEIKEDLIVAMAEVVTYTSSVGRAYGSKELKSHYQGSSGVGSRS